MLDGTLITQDVHADLYVRMAMLAKQANPGGFFFHNLTDDPDSPAGVLNDYLTPRPTYTALKAYLGG